MQIPENIKNLVEKYLDGSATAKERAIVNNWYNSFSTDEVEVNSSDAISEKIIEKRIRQRLIQFIQHQEKSKIYWLKTAAAAAIIIIIGLSVYIFTNYNKKGNPVVAKIQQELINDLTPGGNKAVLTLADGSTIILDSAANGLLTQQGNIQIQKLDNGLLAYTINGKLITENDQDFYNTISTPRGGQYQITLADGTKVWLNAASSIRFPVVFTGNERKVEITGEAYLEVAKNIAKPFKVNAGNSEIEVLGTHFNVNSYEDEDAIKTTLLEGSVKVSVPSSPQQTKVIKPGQQTGISKDGIIKVVNNAEVEEAVAWKNGKFQFKSADLKSILRQISRWYDVDVEYKGNTDLHFTGQLTRSENASKVFEKLELTGEVHFKVEGKKIIVSP